MKRDDAVKRELAKASKSVSNMQETITHIKACKATYVLESMVRTVENGQTVVKTITTYHPNKKMASMRLAEEYKEVTGQELTGHDDFVRFEADDGSVVAMFEIYKPVVG